jgi:methionyl-tRNA synthetase
LAKSEDPADLARCAAVVERCIAYLELIARRLAPFCPQAADRLRGMLGEVAGPLVWGPEDAERAPTSLAAGLALGETEVLFTKIDDDTIEAEIHRLNSVVV